MSSLIDRQDAIKVASKECYELRGVFGRIEDNLNELPTVKAIPIEWILKWACEFVDPNSEGYKMAMELVHDWEKENEID